MTFITAGLAIAGLVSIAAPILIHMLSRQRRKPVQWAAMKFLIEAFRKHRRRLQIEQLLLLLVRCLILALLGFALARPLLENAGLLNVGASRAIFFVIDDGLAASASDQEGGVALDHHIESALELISTLDVGDAVGLVTTARPAQARLVPPSSDHGAVARIIGELKPQQSASDIPGSLELLRDAIADLDDRYDQILVYLLSEFRDGSAALNSPLASTLEELDRNTILLASPPAERAVPNVQIVSIEPLRSLVLPGVLDGSGQVVVRLERHGSALDREVSRVRLSGAGVVTLEPRVIQWQPGQSEAHVDFTLDFAVSGNREIGLTASIENDALNGDNQRHVVLEMRDQIHVLLIDRRSFGFEPTIDRLSSGQWLRRALEPMEDNPIEVINVEPTALDVVDLRSTDAVVLPRPDLLTSAGWILLREFVDGGGLLLVLPPEELNVHPWVETFQRELDLPWRVMLEVQEQEPAITLANEQPASELLRMISSEITDLSLPIVAVRTLPLDPEQAPAEHVLRFADGTPMLVLGAPGIVSKNGETDEGEQDSPSQGLVAYLAVAPSLSWTNLPSEPLMVPLVQEIIRQGLSLTRAGRHYHVGDQPRLVLGPAVRDLIDPEGKVNPLTADGRPQHALTRAGLHEAQDQAAHHVGTLAVNVDAASGRTQTQSAAAVESWLSDSGSWELYEQDELTAALESSRSGASLAGLILWIVLGLILLETLMARFFSHAFRSERGGRRFGGIQASVESTQGRAVI